MSRTPRTQNRCHTVGELDHRIRLLGISHGGTPADHTALRMKGPLLVAAPLPAKFLPDAEQSLMKFMRVRHKADRGKVGWLRKYPGRTLREETAELG